MAHLAHTHWITRLLMDHDPNQITDQIKSICDHQQKFEGWLCLCLPLQNARWEFGLSALMLWILLLYFCYNYDIFREKKIQRGFSFGVFFPLLFGYSNHHTDFWSSLSSTVPHLEFYWLWGCVSIKYIHQKQKRNNKPEKKSMGIHELSLFHRC